MTSKRVVGCKRMNFVVRIANWNVIFQTIRINKKRTKQNNNNNKPKTFQNLLCDRMAKINRMFPRAFSLTANFYHFIWIEMLCHYAIHFFCQPIRNLDILLSLFFFSRENRKLKLFTHISIDGIRGSCTDRSWKLR